MERELTREAQANPEQHDDIFRLLVESVRDYAIFLLDPSGHIQTWNEGARRIKLYEKNEIVGKHFSIFYPAQEIRRGKPEYELKVAADEGRWEEEGWRIRKDGTRFWASVVITALRNVDGELVGFAKVTRDLTERKQAEEERAQLLELERAARSQTEGTLEQLRAIQRVTDAAFAHLDLDELLGALLDRISEIMLIDSVAVLLLNDAANELVLRASRGMKDVEQGLRIPVGAGFAGTVASERRPLVLHDVDSSDAMNWILEETGIRSLLGVPLTVEGRGMGVLQVGSMHHRQFTETDTQFLQLVGDRVALAIRQAKLIDEAQTARREAELASATLQARDQFLSVAAHELKTPMTSLRLSAQMLLRRLNQGRTPDPESLHRALGTIDQQVDRLSRLVTQLIETTRQQAGHLTLQRTRTDVGLLVRSAVRQAQALTTRHEIVLAAADSLWAFVDEMRIEQVIINLLDNAIKFSPDGGRIEVELSQPEPDRVCLAVRDHGLGVPLEHRAHLFERFYQAHGGDYRSGMGLGLFISREIIELHGGTITAEFPSDSGTRFVVGFPNALEDSADRGGEGAA